MAKLTGKVDFPKVDYSGDWQTGSKAQQAALEELEKRSDALPEGEVVGAVIQFQVADGYAVYLVTKAKGNAIELKHIDYGDGYTIPPAHIRGLTRADVLQQLKIRKLFTRRAS